MNSAVVKTKPVNLQLAFVHAVEYAEFVCLRNTSDLSGILLSDLMSLTRVEEGRIPPPPSGSSQMSPKSIVALFPNLQYLQLHFFAHRFSLKSRNSACKFLSYKPAKFGSSQTAAQQLKQHDLWPVFDLEMRPRPRSPLSEVEVFRVLGILYFSPIFFYLHFILKC